MISSSDLMSDTFFHVLGTTIPYGSTWGSYGSGTSALTQAALFGNSYLTHSSLSDNYSGLSPAGVGCTTSLSYQTPITQVSIPG